VPRVGARPQDAAHFHAAHDRQIQIQNDQIRWFFRDVLQRRVSAADDEGIDVAAAFEGVLNQSCDVVLVFDDEHFVP
jgi:hypothetical protein